MRERVLPGVDNARDLGPGVFAQVGQGQFAREIHGKLVANIGKAGMHFRRIGARRCPHRRILGP